MKVKDTVLAAALMIFSLPGAGPQSGGETDEDIFAAKLKMQFSGSFEIETAAGIPFAFQAGVGEKRRKHLEKLPVSFGSVFGALVDHASGLNEGLRLVIFDSKSIYNKEFSSAGLFGHYSPASKTIYTYQSSGDGTLFHELAHHYIRIVYGEDVPFWFDEGLASYFEKRVGGKFGCTNWRLPALKKALKKGTYLPLDDILEGSIADESFYLAEVRHFFVYLDHLGVMKAFLIDVKKAGNFSDEGRVEKLTGKSIDELDQDFRNKIASWEKNVYVGSGAGAGAIP